MYFIGDLAINESFSTRGFDFSEYFIVNCEGYLVDSPVLPSFDKGVYNNFEAIVSAFDEERLLLSLANNHIMDKCDGVTSSLEILKHSKIGSVGAGKDLISASSATVIRESGVEVAIISAGWDLIGCVHATETKQGVMPLKDALIKSRIKEQKALGRKVALFLHWGYETEIYPLPLHRKMAFGFIDQGADIIIGCHAHCLQGCEVYRGKHIFYGIGNGAFQQNYYYDGKLKFPDYCDVGMAVQWDPCSNTVKVAELTYNEAFMEAAPFCSKENYNRLTELSNFSHLDERQYYDFFRKNRLKRKGLPIFMKKDTSIDYFLKLNYTKVRAGFIHFLFKLGIKKR
ncbi:CapA family protein [Pseudoalteromonas sp. Of11M-6]|uniref:CapA family protein n=1 Tax=Pseudoalteromonas sp. Of11M-6 TaxID=2917754 RepID=UPI001EF667AB|nr:CapA family protein [Pseudoalteromonas sp. Of11M-6]MCG7555757.1 CapA family protein [Pseudoalteromonas sp. Of11M-6]